MYMHAVMFRFEDKNQAKIVMDKLTALQDGLSTLRSLRCVINERDTPRSCDLLLLTEFDDEAGYLAYDEDPNHVVVKEYIASVSAAPSTVVDGRILR